jgi:hypothetical protein
MTAFKPTDVNHEGLTALIQNLGRDCPPSQYLREFLKNAIEACQRTQIQNSEIILDFNEEIFQETGHHKLCFIDNGDGMSDEQMLLLLNNLSASGSKSNEHQNYGVGAKISAMTRNHAGILYESYQNNQGYAVLIKYLTERNIFGVQGFVENDQTIYAKKIDPNKKPRLIEAHGTRVTLLGMNLDQDTMLPPEGLNFPKESWISQFLSARFFELPKNISIKTRIGYSQDPANSKLNYLAPIEGYRAALDRNSQSHGFLRLEDANAYWWIMKVDSSIPGHAALINQGEIFDKREPWQNPLGPFGIIVGRDRVVIYIEPDNAEQNTARTNLVKKDGSSLNWPDWHHEFRENLPQEIKDFIDDLLNASSQKTHAKNIRKRLRDIFQLFIISGYKPIPSQFDEYIASEDLTKEKKLVIGVAQDEGVEIESTEAGDAKENIDSNSESDSNEEPPNPEDENRQENPGEEFLPAELDLNFFPKVQWTNEERSPHVVGMAAEYLQESHIVLANRDFKGYKDLIRYFEEQYPDDSNMYELIINYVNEGFEQAFMESVAGILSLQGSHSRWDNKAAMDKAFSMEALTASVMQRYWMTSNIAQRLKNAIAEL